MIILNAAELSQSIIDHFFHDALYSSKIELKRALHRRSKEIRHSLLRFEKELTDSFKWGEKEKEAQLLQMHFSLLKRGEKLIEVTDWETERPMKISLDPLLTPQQEVASRFKAAKKLKKAIPHLQLMLIKNRVYLRKIELLALKIPFATSVEELEFLREMAGVPKKQELPTAKRVLERSKPYFEFYSEANIPIWVGKSAKENDLLTFQHANGLDTWLHAADCPGSHVIVRNSKGEKPDPETMKDAIELALHYSKAKSEAVSDVVITLTKYVKRFGKNQPGKVQLAQQKIVRAKRDPERLKRLKG